MISEANSLEGRGKFSAQCHIVEIRYDKTEDSYRALLVFSNESDSTLNEAWVSSDLLSEAYQAKKKGNGDLYISLVGGLRNVELLDQYLIAIGPQIPNYVFVLKRILKCSRSALEFSKPHLQRLVRYLITISSTTNTGNHSVERRALTHSNS